MQEILFSKNDVTLISENSMLLLDFPAEEIHPGDNIPFSKRYMDSPEARITLLREAEHRAQRFSKQKKAPNGFLRRGFLNIVFRAIVA